MSSKKKATAVKSDGKAALVPRLRFPEFRGAEGWKSVTLGEVSTQVTEIVGDRKLTPVSISAGIGFVPQAEKFGRDISGNQYQRYTLVETETSSSTKVTRSSFLRVVCTCCTGGDKLPRRVSSSVSASGMATQTVSFRTALSKTNMAGS